jgi:hypothetical protein
MAGGLVGCLPFQTWEPVSGIEPLTCRLQEARPCATRALAAQAARVIALMALAALGLSGEPVHEPVHARGPAPSHPATVRNVALGAASTPCRTSLLNDQTDPDYLQHGLNPSLR